MMYLADERIKKGVQICVQSVQLVYEHPIMLVYVLLDGIFALLAGVVAYYVGTSGNGLASIASLFLDFCIARHTMHILRQQPQSMGAVFSWVCHHTKQIVLWIIVSALFIILGAIFVIIPITLLKGMGERLQIVSIVIAGILTLLYLVMISFMTGIVIPILATEKISVVTAFKRSLHVIWNNALTYFVMVTISLLPCIVLLSFFAVVTAYPTYIGMLLASFMAMLLTIFLTIAKTIFYYIFYVQPSLELAEISMTQQM